MASSPATPSLAAIDQRYLGAWNEINTRIALRQALITIYTSLTLASIGAPLLQASNSGLWRLAYAVPPLSVLFAMLLRMHERMIRLLILYLIEWDVRSGAEPALCYFAGEWSAQVAKVRRSHDLVCLALVLGLNGIAGFVVFVGPRATELTFADHIACGVLALVAGLALWLIWGIFTLRDPAMKTASRA
ncbi:hypothetical protein AYO40_02975 [Planctomycetaceae bacterium SCGC AG-212-D15]|nr:hypothetical protein AYO40_02975 [Planctomycetaceae bacterium SCGC AG-212-D15]